MKFESIEELLEYTKGIRGKTFKEFDLEKKLDQGLTDKGTLGKIIETGFYQYPNNNKAEADFSNLGVELKVSGYVKNKNGTISAKERLVLGRIDYKKIVDEDFSYSNLFLKSNKMLIIWYEYDKKKNVKDFVITDYQLYDMSGDELVIRNDFEIIKQKVVDGKAHMLSEGETAYLGACTKGRTGKDRTKQPFSEILAMPRAFSLKNSYMTGIIREYNLELAVDEVEYKSITDYVFAQINAFIGKTQIKILEELCELDYSNKKVPKQISKMISDKTIGKDEELPYKNELFLKTNYIIKNIPISEEGYPLERMAFRNLVLSEFSEEWEKSQWKNYFEEVTIIVLCYEGDKFTKNGFRILKDIKQISFNDDDVELFERTYERVRETIQKGNITLLPRPNTIAGQILEVAPKGQKNDDAYNNFLKKDNTKVCFMLNKDFLFKKLCE